jgi:YggT family protein
MNYIAPLFDVIDAILGLYFYVMLATVVASWLVSFNIVNMRQRGVYTVVDLLRRLTEPVLGPIRRILPNFGGLDVSPMIAMLIIYLIRRELYAIELDLVR